MTRVHLVPHDPTWGDASVTEATRIRDAVDSRAYTEAKTDFIRGIDRRAIAWLATR